MVVDTKNNWIHAGSKLPYLDADLGTEIKALMEGEEQKGERAKPANGYRIMVIGDSIAVGGELKRGEVGFPLLLRDMLKKDFPEKNIETFVFGHGGYSTPQEVEGYERYGRFFMPDLVILSYCHNDTAEAGMVIRKMSGLNVIAFYKCDNLYLKNIPFNRFFVENFLMARFLNEMVIKACLALQIKIDPDLSEGAPKRIFNAFEKLSLLTKNAGIPVAVVVFPYLEESEDLSRKKNDRAY